MADAQGVDNLKAGSEPVIGLLLPPEEAEGASLRDGVVLAVDEANQAAASQTRLIIRGRVGQWGADGVEAARMVIDDGVAAVIAPPDGSATHLVLQVAGRTAVPVVTLCADSSVSLTGVPWMARVAPQTVEECKALLSGLKGNRPGGLKRWVALIPEGRAGREIGRDLKEAAATNDCVLDKVLEIKVPLTSAERVTREILEVHPGGVLIWLDREPAAEIVKCLRKAHYQGALAGPSRLRSTEFISAAGDAVEGFILASPVTDDDSGSVTHKFEASFRSRFGHEPSPTAALGYDAAKLLLHLLGQAGASPLHRSFPLNLSLPGASGVLTFDSAGNRKTALQLLTAYKGRFVPTRGSGRAERSGCCSLVGSRWQG